MNAKARSPQLFLYANYASLASGMFLAFSRLIEPDEKRLLAAGVLLLICSGIWIFRLAGHRALLPLCTALAGLYGLIALSGLPLSPAEMAALSLLALICYLFGIRLRLGTLIVGAISLFLLAGSLFGYPIEGLGVFLIFFYSIGNTVYLRVFANHCVKICGASLQVSAAESGMALGALCFLIAACTAGLLPREHMNALLQSPVLLQQRILQNLEQRGIVSPGSGVINRGNNLPTGEERLRITLSHMPEDRLYLKNYTGGVYLGNRWDTVDDMEYYRNLREQSSSRFSQYYYLSPSQFDTRQFEAVRYGKWEEWTSLRGYDWNVDIAKAYGEWSGIESIAIEKLTEGNETIPVPYLSSYAARQENGMRLYFSYPWTDFERYLSGGAPLTMEWFGQIESAYRDYARETYLQVPSGRLPGLSALVRDNPMAAPEDITAFIRETLWSRADYTLTPGLIPFGQDVAEYFLFVGGQGYCQHFATAAALMYRMYGIPSRYAAGYAVSPDSFVRTADGTYEAVVTDAQAHAWVEIYRDGAGWVPAEMTPPAGFAGFSHDQEAVPVSSAVQRTPGSPVSENTASDHSPAQNASSDDTAENSALSSDKSSVTDGSEAGASPQNTPGVLSLFFLIGLAALLCALGIHRRKRIYLQTAAGIYVRTAALLRLAGYPLPWDTAAPAAPGGLPARTAPANTLGQADLFCQNAIKIRRWAQKELFAKDGITPEEKEMARLAYGQIRLAALQNLKGPRRLELQLLY